MHWATAGVAVVAIVIFLLYSPFPAIFRVLIPFTFFLQYQFAVVARSYVFFTLAVFALAALFNARRPRPVLFAVLCGLLANTSLYGVCTAFGFFTVYAYCFYQAKRQAQARGSRWSGLKLPAFLFLFLSLLAIYTALPTPDGTFGPSGNLNGKGRVQHLLSLVTFTHAGPMGAEPPAAALPTPAEMGIPFHQSSSFRDRLWRFLELRKDVSAPELMLRKVSRRVYVFLCVLTFPISSWNWLAVLFLIALFLWLRERQQLLLLLPYLFLLLLCTLVACEPHNSGVLWITLLAVLWIALSESPSPNPVSKAYISLCTLLFLVAAGQIAWTITTVRNDYEKNYDTAWMAARFIRALPPGRQVVAFDVASTGIEPYFPKNIFQNQSHSFWPWSKSQDPASKFEQVMQSKPDLVVVSDLYSGDELIRNQWLELERPWTKDPAKISSESMSGYGYSSVARFCGQTFIRFGAERQICYALFEPASKLPSSPAGPQP
jgi:hypothetical protein